MSLTRTPARHLDPPPAAAPAARRPSRRDCPRAFRAGFAETWSRFLRVHYASPEEVAVCFGVRFQTALNWWQGVHRPTGDVVARAAVPLAAFLARRG